MKRLLATALLSALLWGTASSARAQIPTFDQPEPKLAYGPGHYRYAPPPQQHPAYYAPPRYDLRHGAVVLVYAGANIPVGSEADDYSAGFTFGGIFGGHLNREVSLNGELSLSFLSYDYASSFDSEYLGDLTFSPLFHFGQGNTEFAVGPKLGFYSWHVDYNDAFGTYASSSARGLVFGVNAALLFQVARTFSVGGLLSIYSHHATRACDVDPDGYEACGDPIIKQPTLVNLNFAMRW